MKINQMHELNKMGKMLMAWMKLENYVDEMEFGNNCYQNNIMECNMYQ
jgi:hypothetical protein